MEDEATSSETAATIPTEPTISRVAIKLPPFWRQRPEAWFRQVEANFSLSGITQDMTKYNYVIASLDGDTLEQVSDILYSPPPTDLYSSIKGALITRFADSKERKLKTLLTDIHLGDRTPSQLLRVMTDLARGALSEDALKSLWLQRLPTNIQTVLSASRDDISQLAMAADRIMEVTEVAAVRSVGLQPTTNELPEIAPDQTLSAIHEQLQSLQITVAALVERRNRPRFRRSSHSRTPPRSPDAQFDRPLCWYHWRFGNAARKCVAPCSAARSISDNDGTNQAGNGTLHR